MWNHLGRQRLHGFGRMLRFGLAVAAFTSAALTVAGAQSGPISPEGATALEAARKFVEVVDSGNLELAVDSVQSSSTPMARAVNYRMLRMRLARGALTNTRLIDFRPSRNSADGFPFTVSFESDAVNDVIYGGSVRKTSVIQITVGRVKSSVMIGHFTVQY